MLSMVLRDIGVSKYRKTKGVFRRAERVGGKKVRSEEKKEGGSR